MADESWKWIELPPDARRIDRDLAVQIALRAEGDLATLAHFARQRLLRAASGDAEVARRLDECLAAIRSWNRGLSRARLLDLAIHADHDAVSATARNAARIAALAIRSRFGATLIVPDVRRWV